MDDKYLKQITEELKLIRLEHQLQNDLLMKDMGMDEEPKEVKKHRPDIVDQLKNMFDKGR